MPVPNSLLAADRDQQFRDWAEPITLRLVAQSYNPETLQATESATDVTLDAIIGLAPQSPTPATAARHHTQDITATVRRDDLPALAPGPHTRILWNGAEYEVTDAIDAPAAQLTTLHARRIG